MSRWLYLSVSVVAVVSLAATFDDRRLIPAPPAEPTPSASPWWSWLGYFAKPTRALGVTALDEVPDSTWFTNRNTLAPLSLDAIRKGPAVNPTPRDNAKWTVTAMKHTGVAIGVRARDDAGADFFLKFDPLGHDEVETGADVVAQRLLYAAGYNVPENDVVYFAREALAIGDGAMIKDGDRERALTVADLDALLARAAREPDGRYRALASRFIAGKPLGGIRAVGTRLSDPNDRIRHEDRRDMRGLFSIAAWLNHTDMKPGNTHDTWIADANDPTRGFVVHYLLDFGKALGAMTRIDERYDVGFAYHGERGLLFVQHMTTGTPVPWTGIGPFPNLRGLGWLESERFDPAGWKPLFHWLPFEKADRFDKFWGARIVGSFTPEQIRAAVEAARYSDPRTVDALVRVLVERQRKVVAAFYREVAPLDRFEVRDGALCFIDLWQQHGLGEHAKYFAGDGIGELQGDGSVCIGDASAPGDVDIRIERAGVTLPSTRVRIGADGGVIAIERR